MEKIKEEISYLKQLSNNYFNAILLINSGLAGLLISNIDIIKLLILFIIGIYFDIVCIIRFQTLNNQIKLTLKELN